MTTIDFLKKYIIHHFWLGIIMIIESIVLFYRNITIWGFIYLGLGIFFLLDDILAETKDISVMKKLPSKIQEENTLKLIGVVIFIIIQIWFIYLIFLKSPQFQFIN